MRAHIIFQPVSDCTAPLAPLGHQDLTESPERLVHRVNPGNLVRMDWMSILKMNPPSLASFALQVHPGVGAPREIPALEDREGNLDIMEWMAVVGSTDE